jgi:hypothetical protein
VGLRTLTGGGLIMAKKFTRIQFDLSEEDMTKVNWLMEEFGSPTRAHLIRKSLRLLRLYLEETKAGNEPQVSGPDGVKKIFIL